MTSSSSSVSTSEAFRWAAVIGAVPPSFTLKMSATNKQTGHRYQQSAFSFFPEWLKLRCLRVSSVGGWLSTGNTVTCRSYTGRVWWAVLLILTGLPPLQHKASVSVSSSEMTKVMVSWRGVSPISTSKNTNVKKVLTEILWIILCCIDSFWFPVLCLLPVYCNSPWYTVRRPGEFTLLMNFDFDMIDLVFWFLLYPPVKSLLCFLFYFLCLRLYQVLLPLSR